MFATFGPFAAFAFVAPRSAVGANFADYFRGANVKCLRKLLTRDRANVDVAV
jgi:hypothetical protein